MRFRSRVRIGSGLHRNSSASSSVSGSPSSSVSAPLRSHGSGSGSGSGWGPLGLRVGSGRRASFTDFNHEQSNNGESERTPLMRSASEGYGGVMMAAGQVSAPARSAEDDHARLSREVDAVFGKWPTRLLNHHVRGSSSFSLCSILIMQQQWWWWQIEPVVCCHCIEDSDVED